MLPLCSCCGGSLPKHPPETRGKRKEERGKRKEERGKRKEERGKRKE
jgi:hypothetical protein